MTCAGWNGQNLAVIKSFITLGARGSSALVGIMGHASPLPLLPPRVPPIIPMNTWRTSGTQGNDSTERQYNSKK